MDIRNVQKTGDMHYIYLPTSWCKKHNINSKSKVSIEQTSEGSLSLTPELTEKKEKHLVINTPETNQEIIHKLIVSCYINPALSFRINLEKEPDFTELLNHKKLINIESVEFDKKAIFSESIMDVSDPQLLLKTMVRKVKNLLMIMISNYDKEMINRYEDEIDRNKLNIDKSVITALTFYKPSKLRTIELHYISLIARDLERIVDFIILIDKKDKMLLKTLSDVIDSLKDLLENITERPEKFNYKNVTLLIKQVLSLKKVDVKDLRTYNIRRIRLNFVSISDVLLDWSITKELDNS